MIRVALTKGRIERNIEKMFKEMGYDVSSMVNKDRQLLVNVENKFLIAYMKSEDVVNLVDNGDMDVGIVGSDTFLELSPDNSKQLVDFECGNCYFALSGFSDYKNLESSCVKRIATKYPNITKRFFERKNENVEIVKLNGSVELGPVLGISDAIVDIVETGGTLKANGLEILEPIGSVSTRLIVNNERYKEKCKEIDDWVEKINLYKSNLKVKDNNRD